MRSLKPSLLIIALLAAVPTQAQVSPILTDIVATPQFFVSLLAGIVLAIGFQVLLTSLSVAAGVSAIGNIRKKVNDASGSSNSGGSNDDDTPLGVKISSGLGAWTLITVSIALFFASLLAVKLSLIGTPIIGVTLGLVIWGAFFTAMVYLEINSVKTLLGTLIGTAFAGIRQAMSTVQDVFSASQASKIEHITQNTVEKVRAELEDAFDLTPINEKIDEYVTRLEETADRAPDYDQIKQDFIDILQDVRIEERTERDVNHKETEIFLKLASEQSNLSKRDVKKMQGAFKQAQRAMKEGEGREAQAKKLAAQFTPASEAQIDEYVGKIETYLRETDRDEIKPEAIRQDIEKIIENPQHAADVVKQRAGRLNRDTLVSLLETHRKMDHEKAEKVVSYVEHALEQVVGKSEQAQQQAQQAQQQAQGKMTALKEKAQQNGQQSNGQSSSEHYHSNGSGSGGGLEAQLRDYLARTDRPEIQYESLKWDIERMLQDPKSAPEIARNRLQKFDKETLVALLTANDKLSRRDIDNLSDQVYASRDEALRKLDAVEMETRRRVEEAKQVALQQAENTRKTAAAAAWWLFGTAVVSAAASAIGGLIAII